MRSLIGVWSSGDNTKHLTVSTTKTAKLAMCNAWSVSSSGAPDTTMYASPMVSTLNTGNLEVQ
jgi:hypothetical protein